MIYLPEANSISKSHHKLFCHRNIYPTSNVITFSKTSLSVHDCFKSSCGFMYWLYFPLMFTKICHCKDFVVDLIFF